MRHIRHNAIVVTSARYDLIEKAVEFAERIGLQVLWSNDVARNSYRSILICPDGSKEEWSESDDGDYRRMRFRSWLNDQRHEDGDSALEWVEIAYGDDDKKAEVVTHAWSVNDMAGKAEDV